MPSGGLTPVVQSAGGAIIIDHTIKYCAILSEDLTAVVQSEGGMAHRVYRGVSQYLIVSSIIGGLVLKGLRDMKIDILYLWVDGNDAKWLAKKNAELTKTGGLPDDIAGKVRYEDNDELLFSLRSIEKFAPWINHIFIVTDNQTPKWLDLNNPKISIIDHTEIMPPEALPCFNSSVIEFFIPNIQNLAEHFIYANDDTLFMAKTESGYFFTKNGIPIVRVNSGKKIGEKTTKLFPAGEKFRTLWENCDLYDCKKLNSRKLLYDIIGGYNCPWQEAHIMDPYRKSDLITIVNMPLVKETLKKTMKHHFRSRYDIHRSLFHLFGVVKFGYKIVKNSKWTHIKQLLTFRFRDMPCFAFNIKKTMRRRPLRRKTACINDPGDDSIRKSNHDYLLKMFPRKSEFEK